MKQRGFTLIELLIVVLIVVILASIAVPSYRAFVVRANRTDALDAILRASSCLERLHTKQGNYTNGNATCAVADTTNYRLLIAIPTAQTYTLTAQPLGGQATGDSKCGVLRLQQDGNKTAGIAANADKCWGGR